MEYDSKCNRQNIPHPNVDVSEIKSPYRGSLKHANNRTKFHERKHLTSLRIIYWNINGIGEKLKDEDVQALIKRHEIVVFAETKKGPNYIPNIPGYKAKHISRKYKHPKSNRYDGGILVMVAESVLSYVKVELSMEHLVWVSINRSHHIGFVYIPPPTIDYNSFKLSVTTTNQ